MYTGTMGSLILWTDEKIDLCEHRTYISNSNKDDVLSCVCHPTKLQQNLIIMTLILHDPDKSPSLCVLLQEKDDELCEFVQQYEEQLAKLKVQNEVYIKEIETTWKARAEKMVKQREGQLQQEMDGLTQEWTRERRVRHYTQT